MQRYGHGSRKDLLIDDEGHRGDVEHRERRSGKPYQPLPALGSLLDDPTPHRRQPEDNQWDADRDGLIEALVEDGITIAVSGAERLEAIKQQQVKDDESPDLIRANRLVT